MNQLTREFEFTARDFRFISDLIKRSTGIVLADHKRDMVYARIARRLRALKLRTFYDYCLLLEADNGSEEMGNFVNAITTNLTSFFRESHHFEHLRTEILNPLAKHPPNDRRIRLWSAACSSGAEPYSMAMTLCETIPNLSQWDCKILATDIDTGMLAKCQSGQYNHDESQGIPQSMKEKYCLYDHQHDTIAMGTLLKSLIRFNPLNLIELWPFKGPFDAIFCRNVVIYFDKDTQRTLFERMANMLKPEGWLYIGHSESLHTVSDRFHLHGKTIYRRVA